MAVYSNKFRIDDKVRCTEDIFSDVYNKNFKQNHEFMVKGLESRGLILEDEDGYLLKNVGFMRFEVVQERGDYLENNNSGWRSDRAN